MKLRILFATLSLMALLFLGVGCMAPFDTPELVEITPSQTAFMIPLDGKTSEQAAFSSEKFLDDAKVATKRVQVPHRELKIGRAYWDVKHIPTVKVIVVERKPVTREWTEDEKTGTSTQNQAIIAETRESLRLVARMNCVAQIDEADATRFLFRYNNKPLEEIMDSEIRARIESKFVEECAKYFLRDETNGVLAHKLQIMQSVRDYTIPYFKERGITINVIGLKGDFTYDPDVQKSINERFTTMQQKLRADNDAYVARLLKASGGMDYQLRLKQLEIQKQQQDNIAKAIEAWKGGAAMPSAIGGGGFLFNIPVTQPATPASPPAQ